VRRLTWVLCQSHVYLAKVAEQCERYEDMVKHVKAVRWLAPCAVTHPVARDSHRVRATCPTFFSSSCRQMASSAPGPLTVEHRNLLSVAFKNVVGACRASWRALNAYEASDAVRDGKGAKEMYVPVVCVNRSVRPDPSLCTPQMTSSELDTLLHRLLTCWFVYCFR